MLPPIAELTAALATGRTTSRALVEACLERIADGRGEGARVFTRTYAGAARDAADEVDRLREHGLAVPPLAGIPVSIKDLFDVEGESTLAGSLVLEAAPPAEADAAIVARLRRAGMVVIGKTNMTEFAFSGLGLNPHYGTPANPWDRATGRIPGGSSSGAAVSVSDGMAAAGIGTDTGGSVRIPAALCGLTGFKPTARRVSREGCYPLSPTLDSIGPIARTVACCAALDRQLADDPIHVPPVPEVSALHLGVLGPLVFEGLDAAVAGAVERAIHALSAAGARITDVRFPELDDLRALLEGGGLVVLEAYAHHRERLASRAGEYDPRVASRILRGAGAPESAHRELAERRAAFVAAATRAAAPFDALLLPTAAIVAPPLAELEASDEAYVRANARVLRNTTVVNLFDGCALSVPCHEPGAAPVGLMIAGASGQDAGVLATGLAIEPVVRRT